MLRPLTTVIVLVALAASVTSVYGGEIHRAVEAGDLARVTALLDADAGLVSAPDDSLYNYQPLHTAAAAGQLEIARLLLARGASVDGPDSDRSTPLHVAAVRRQPEMVSLLLEAGADPNFQDDRGAWALSFAASGGDSACVHRLLEAGARLDLVNDNGMTLAHYAIRPALGDLLARVLEAGVDPNARTVRRGESALQWAAARGWLPQVERLLEAGADPNLVDDNGAAVLSYAAASGDTATVDRLLAAGARFDIVANDSSTVLHHVARHGMTYIVDRALAAGADLEARNDEGETALHKAAQNGRLEMIEHLIAAGADLHAPNQWGATPHIGAIWSGQPEAALALIDHGADVNRTDNWGRTPLLTAATHGDSILVSGLLARGADTDRSSHYGETPLYRATVGGHTALVDMLLAAGARPAVREARTGCTPLHQAAMRGYGDIVARLVDVCPDLDARNAAGETSLDLANRYRNASVARALVGRGAQPADPPPACPAEAAGLAACARGAQPDGSAGTALALGDARYWYLGHSGYAFQTRNHLLIFDYWSRGRAPDEPALCNGFIDPTEIAGQNVTVFVSHEHGDHLDPVIFEWADAVPDIRYFTGCPAETDVAYEQLAPRTVREVDGLIIRTIESNDSGLGFLVEVDGLVIYHAGDHANRLRDFSGPFCAEIDWLAETAPRPDLVVLPVSGCGFGDLEAVRLGSHYVFDTLRPRVFLPAHAMDFETRYDEFIAAARDDAPEVRMVAPDHRGDHFEYLKDRDVASR